MSYASIDDWMDGQTVRLKDGRMDDRTVVHSLGTVAVNFLERTEAFMHVLTDNGNAEECLTLAGAIAT